MPASPSVQVFPSLAALSDAAAAHVARLVAEAPAGSFAMALAGGSTPRALYHLLGSRYRDTLPWPRIHLFWGDERFVPPDDPASNYAMAQEALVRHVPIPEANIHPISTNASSPEEAAAGFEATLRNQLGEEGGLDLTLLGLGEDGHTASLFPGSSVLTEDKRWVRAAEAPPDAAPRQRITMTYPLLNASRHVLLLVSGAAKHEPLRAILDRMPQAESYPAAHIRARQSLTWLTDTAAFYGERG